MSIRSFALLAYRKPPQPRRFPNLQRTLGLAFGLLLAASASPAPAQSAGAHPATGKVLHLAAAADLQPVLPALAAAYEAATGVKLIASFGSSATLTEQILNGAPQDVFLSADFTHPEQLVAAGLTLEHEPVAYARGVLVLWARKDSPAQPLSIDSLSKPSVTRIAVANDLHAPYGLAATAALRSLSLKDKLASKLVVAENIGQTAQFVESGNAQIGFISLTAANSPRFRAEGTFLRLPAIYPPILQTGVALKSSKEPAAAEAFLTWLTGPATQAKLPALGLDPAQ